MIIESLEAGMLRTIQFRKFLLFGMVAALWSVQGMNGETGSLIALDATAGTPLDRRYFGLYNLDFSGAAPATKKVRLINQKFTRL
jgi:hypothetical protein